MWTNVFPTGLPWQTTSQRSSDRRCHFLCSRQTRAGKTYLYIIEWFYHGLNFKALRQIWPNNSWQKEQYNWLSLSWHLSPVRIQYCSQEIVIIREDLVNKMCRNCVRLPNNNLDIPNHVSFSFSKTTLPMLPTTDTHTPLLLSFILLINFYKWFYNFTNFTIVILYSLVPVC